MAARDRDQGHVSIHAPARGAARRTSLAQRPTPSFDPRSRAGSGAAALVRHARAGVSIHAPARGAAAASRRPFATSRFRSTLPRGERHLRAAAAPASRCFDPRSRAGSGRATGALPANAFGFDPRSRAGSGARQRVRNRARDVSIHAPARGAAGSKRQPHPIDGVSIHAPARGAAIVGPKMVGLVTVSIHAPARGAAQPIDGEPEPAPVSIHAPARGAAPAGSVGPQRRAVSIHAPARGAATAYAGSARCADVSIHAPARGAACEALCGRCYQGSFDPRSRAGSGVGPRVARHRVRVSIHAPARGAAGDLAQEVGGVMFRSTLPRGERPRALIVAGASGGFRSTLPRGERRR